MGVQNFMAKGHTPVNMGLFTDNTWKNNTKWCN